MYALLAGPSYLSTRVRVALSTWLRHEEVVLFIEDGFGAVAQELVDNVSLRLNATINCTVVSLPAPSSRVVLGNNGAWKDFPIVQHLALNYADAPWYMIVDDDTFVITHNLNVAMLDLPQWSDTPYFIGQPLAMFQLRMLSVDGGSGILINHAAARLLLPLLNASNASSCVATCKQARR